jgi:hypothetical protein
VSILTDTQVVTASGGLVELGYKTYVGATVSGGVWTSIASTTVVSDGSKLLVEFQCPLVSAAAQGRIVVNGSSTNRFGDLTSGGSYSQSLVITPSAGSVTVDAQFTSAAGSATINGSTGTYALGSAFLRVSKIVSATQWPAVTTGTIICTSTTRPASPFVGQKIYETDTKKELTYDGASWTQPWNQPWGVVGIGTHDTGSQVAANTSFCSVTFSPVLNRYYQAFYTSRTIWATAGTIGIFDSVANGRIAEQYGAPDPVTLQRTKTFSTTASRTLSIRTDGVQTPISGAYSGNERPAQLVVMDVGPA